jgi:GntR family transcriptional regulator, rspAB operon transcriptional repressor
MLSHNGNGHSDASVNGESDASTAARRVYVQLRKEIVDGKLRAGVRLVRRVLSKRLGVSLAPITEALFRLEQDGLVQREPMYGSRVSVLTPEMVRNETILREALECQAARLYAVNATALQKVELAHLAGLVDELNATTNDGHITEEPNAHLSLHLKIACYSRCDLLEDQLQRAWFRRLMQLNNTNARLHPVPRDWHAQLMEVLHRGDPENAERKMREHVRLNREELALLKPSPSATVYEPLADFDCCIVGGH